MTEQSTGSEQHDRDAALSRLIALAAQLAITEEDLDEFVRALLHENAADSVNGGALPDLSFVDAHAALHDKADEDASDACSEGVPAQLSLLLGGIGEDHVTDYLHELAP